MTSIPNRPAPSRILPALKAAAVLVLWAALYGAAAPAARHASEAAASLFPWMTPVWEEALEFLLYDTVKILLLLVLMVYAISFARAGIDTTRVRAWLSGRNRVAGYVLAALFGAVTPFCSCSSVPLFIGFTAGGIPLGITMAFLITSPIINEVAVVLLAGLIGWKATALYIAAGLAAGVAGGALMDVLHAERWLLPFVKKAAGTAAEHKGGATRPSVDERHRFALAETRTILRRVAPWVLIGVGVGAIIHGFVPEGWIVSHLSAANPWSVPVAVALGIPLYTNVTGVVPVMESLLVKGLPFGTTLAFAMSTVAASLPEALMLRQVMERRLVALFFGVLLVLFTLLGWTLNALL